MAGYAFYPAADASQDRIWRETVDRWGEDQATRYIRGLHTHLQRVSETRATWRRLPRSLVVPTNLKSEAFFSRYEHHYIFFRTLPSGGIGIMSILHERMDLPVRLAEDLAMLSARPLHE